ncbi:nucleotidyltransferase domain-containing protein [Cronobacter turicensis]
MSLTMTDADGFIRVVPDAALQPDFREVVDTVINMLVRELGEALHSGYLYGSVARGEAVKGVSDLDLCLILTRAATDAETTRLAAIKKQAAADYPVISKIDVDIGTVAEVLSADNLYSWGYWLKHHCRCIYGDDLSSRFERFRPSRAIAEAVNGDVARVINDAIKMLANAPDEHSRRQIQRAASRKLLRATNLLRADDDTDWPDTLEEYQAKFAAKYPLKAAEINYFLRESREPADAPDAFMEAVQRFMDWFSQTRGEGVKTS